MSSHHLIPGFSGYLRQAHGLTKKAWSYKPGREPIFFENFDATLSGEDVLPGSELNLSEIMKV